MSAHSFVGALCSSTRFDSHTMYVVTMYAVAIGAALNAPSLLLAVRASRRNWIEAHHSGPNPLPIPP